MLMSARNNRGATLAPDAERLANMLKALGNPIRFQIMQTLAERQVCITGEIVADDAVGPVHGQPAPEGVARGRIDPWRNRRAGDVLLR